MKKITTLMSAALITLMLNSCGPMGTTGTTTGTTTDNSASTGILGAILQSGSGTDATSAIGNIISVFAGGVLTNQSTIVGTWTYVKPCVQFESDNALAKAGGAVAATSVENKLATYYQKVGIKQGSFQFQFNSDGSCAYAIGSRQSTGTYTFNSQNRTITIKTQTGAQLTAYVSVTGSSMGLTFDATKLLSLLQGASTQVSSLSSISQIAGNFSGMKLGFEMQK